MKDNISLVELWKLLSADDLDTTAMSIEIIKDCGVDARGMTQDDLAEMFITGPSTPWDNIAWSFDEVLARYICCKLDKYEFERAVVVVYFLVDAYSRGFGDMEMSFDKMVRLICRNINKGDFEFRMLYFRMISNVNRG